MIQKTIDLLLNINVGNYGNSIVSLQSTSLTRFESGVFQSILEKIEPYYSSSGSTAYVNINSSESTYI